MKWGVRRYQNTDGSLTPAGKKRYKTTGIRAAIARRSNEKVDKGFNDWKENAKKRDDAIALGKKANVAKIAYEKDKTNKSLKTDYKQAEKEYKKALRENTTYRKGVVKQEVERDISRKYLSEAKKIGKQLNNNPTDKNLQKQYDSFMSNHEIERAKARRAVEISTKRMRTEASIKRTMTMTAKAAVGGAAIAGGVYAVNKYLEKYQYTIDGKPMRLRTSTVADVAKLAKKARDLIGYFV